MKSFVTFAVEHGDNTDTLERFIRVAQSQDPSGNDGYTVIDYTVKVDVSLADVLAGLTWDQRATLESGQPI